MSIAAALTLVFSAAVAQVQHQSSTQGCAPAPDMRLVHRQLHQPSPRSRALRVALMSRQRIASLPFCATLLLPVDLAPAHRNRRLSEFLSWHQIPPKMTGPLVHLHPARRMMKRPSLSRHRSGMAVRYQLDQLFPIHDIQAPVPEQSPLRFAAPQTTPKDSLVLQFRTHLQRRGNTCQVPPCQIPMGLFQSQRISFHLHIWGGLQSRRPQQHHTPWTTHQGSQIQHQPKSICPRRFQVRHISHQKTQVRPQVNSR